MKGGGGGGGGTVAGSQRDPTSLAVMGKLDPQHAAAGEILGLKRSDRCIVGQGASVY